MLFLSDYLPVRAMMVCISLLHSTCFHIYQPARIHHRFMYVLCMQARTFNTLLHTQILYILLNRDVDDVLRFILVYAIFFFFILTRSMETTSRRKKAGEEDDLDNQKYSRINMIVGFRYILRSDNRR